MGIKLDDMFADEPVIALEDKQEKSKKRATKKSTTKPGTTKPGMPAPSVADAVPAISQSPLSGNTGNTMESPVADSKRTRSGEAADMQRQQFAFKVMAWHAEADDSGSSEHWKADYNPYHGANRAKWQKCIYKWVYPQYMDIIVEDMMKEITEEMCMISVLSRDGKQVYHLKNY